MENLKKINPEQLLFINGKLTPSVSGETYDVINPTTEEVAGKVAAANAADADLALTAARRCFDETDWSTNTAKRARALVQLRDGLLAVADEWRHQLVAESGVPLAFTYGAMLNSSVTDINYVLELLNSYAFEEEIEDLGSPMGGPAKRIIRKEAAGVVVAITPWNAPVQTNLQKIIPALAAGCTVVLKAANNTPWAATMIGRVASQCPDLPAGALNILTSSPNANIGSLLTSDSRVDVISFTGSTATGSRVMGNASKTIKKTLLELGGKSAMVILDDADFEQSLPAAAFVCANAGQGCIVNSRLLIPLSRYEEAITILEKIFHNIPYGDPCDTKNIMGPMVSAIQRKNVLGYIEKGKAEGARLVVGGGIPKDRAKGYYVEPTLFADVDNKMSIAQEEIFGPVLVVIPFDDDEDAIRIANDSIYGLSGSVVSASFERAMHVARSVRTGSMNVNGAFFFSANAPFGGYKQSGIGRENGVAGFEEYLEIKTIAIPAS
ncbi:aldehyde dehydrogenase [Terrimonas sp.]|uniref:aldehyde dehydrogenase family protein n=1 Tax=Terrimonas sp. TaxID=1914338 RepID=UPI000D50FB88|nr:aldehyde dehydrogenase family protein [Terrimonas sp.]PVD51548.1 aldehyde dehydrogenase [Terrimonas sp.]